MLIFPGPSNCSPKAIALFITGMCTAAASAKQSKAKHTNPWHYQTERRPSHDQVWGIGHGCREEV